MSKQAGRRIVRGGPAQDPMQRPCTVYYVCTIEARWCGGGGGHRERRGPPRRSWVERPYIGASVRWELPYTDRLARPQFRLVQHMRPHSWQAGRRAAQVLPTKTRSRRRKPSRELCVPSKDAAASQLSTLSGQLACSCRSQVAGRS